MATGGTVIWRGDKLLSVIRDAKPEALLAGAELFIREAANRAPQRTGNLAKSGYVSAKGKSTYKNAKHHRKEIKPKGDEVIAAFAAFYAGWVELGTKHMAAKPFMRPTLDEIKDRIGAEIVKRAGKGLK